MHTMNNRIYTSFIVVILGLIAPNLTSKPQQLLPEKWSDIFEESKKSVVQIFTYRGDFDLFRPYRGPSLSSLSGTGFFIENDGYLITNAHVITNALAIFIQLPPLGKERFAVNVIGIHPERDLALLQLPQQEHERLKKALQVTRLPYLPFIENSDLVKASDKIMLVGYPLGHENIKTSQGECSGREYSVEHGSMIQTTVPTNNGNSGGPYLNNNGEIVGVCSYSLVGIGIEGVNYFIPSNTVKTIIPELYKKSIVSNSFFGCKFIATTKHTNHYLKAPEDGGIYITEVYDGGLGKEYGFEKGDILYTVNTLKIDHYGCVSFPHPGTSIELGDYISRFPLNTKILFELYRNGEKITCTCELKEPHVFHVNYFFPTLQNPLDYEIIGGFVFVELTLNHLEAVIKNCPSVEKYLKPKNRLNGHVLISEILPASPAHKARCISNGDWFVKTVNGETIHTVQDIRNAIISHKDTGYITLETDKGTLVVLSLEDILEQEPFLSQQYGYQPSGLLTSL